MDGQKARKSKESQINGIIAKKCQGIRRIPCHGKSEEDNDNDGDKIT